MRSYLLSVFLISIALSILSILAPEGEKGGLTRHLRLLTSLLLVCVLVAPLGTLLERLRGWAEGNPSLPGFEEASKEGYQNELQDALDSASRDYFTQSLTRTLEKEFSIATGQVRCKVFWEEGGNAPQRVTVILSGAAIWKDPEAIEAFVTSLLGCPCQTAIE